MDYKGRNALKVEMTEAAAKAQLGVAFDMPTFVLIPGSFKNGTIEVDILGRLNGKGPPDARAFVGLAYRVANAEAGFESVYLRPLNGLEEGPSVAARQACNPVLRLSGLEVQPCATSIPTGATRAGQTLPTTSGSHSNSTSTTRRVSVSINGKEELARTETKAAPVAGGMASGWVSVPRGISANLRVAPR